MKNGTHINTPIIAMILVVKYFIGTYEYYLGKLKSTCCDKSTNLKDISSFQCSTLKD